MAEDEYSSDRDIALLHHKRATRIAFFLGVCTAAGTTAILLWIGWIEPFWTR